MHAFGLPTPLGKGTMSRIINDQAPHLDDEKVDKVDGCRVDCSNPCHDERDKGIYKPTVG